VSNLNEQQFAKYSSLEVPDKVYGGRTVPLPASMERHAPGEYQPTLPGMEKMLKGEQTHTSVVFKHPAEAERWKDNTGEEHLGDVPNSAWGHLTRNYSSTQVAVRASSLRPSQDWLDDNHLHSPIHEATLANQGTTPKVERIGRKNVIQDGHHRAARAILEGKKTVDIERWGHKGDGHRW
jgi:hypothetical protein